MNYNPQNGQNYRPAGVPQAPVPPSISENTGKYTNPPRIYTVTPKETFTASQKLLAIACLFLGYFYMKVFLFPAAFAGKTVFTLLLLAVSAAYMAANKIKAGVPSVISAVLCALFSVGFIISDSFRTQFTCALFCQLSYTYFVYKAFDKTVEKSPGILFDLDLIKAAIVAPFASFGKVFPAAFSKQKNTKISKNIGYIILGLAVSIIPTAIVIALLSFDEGFVKLLKTIFGYDSIKFEPANHILSIIFGIPVAMYIFGLWISSALGKCNNMNEKSCTDFRRKLRCVPVAMTASATAPVLAVYVIFFISQFTYFTSAFTGVLPEGFSYSEYARSGFFDLCAITVINALIASLIYIFSRKNGKNVVSRILVFLLSLSAVILVAIAASKMLLYVKYYGLTVNRTYTLWFMVTVALIFLLLILKTLFTKFKFTPAALCVIIIMLAVIVFPNVPGVISHYNTERVLEGENWVLDYEYFNQIGLSAVPDAALISENTGKVNAPTADAARAFINDKKEELEGENGGILSFNLPEHIAREILEINSSENP